MSKALILKGVSNMRRALLLVLLTPLLALVVPAHPAHAGPAVDVPAAACENLGHDRAWEMSSLTSNMPNDAHLHHTSCHVHLPMSNPADDSA